MGPQAPPTRRASQPSLLIGGPGTIRVIRSITTAEKQLHGNGTLTVNFFPYLEIDGCATGETVLEVGA